MKQSKKAQGLSMNTIIIAVIGLAVLVVLFAIFTGRIGLFSQGVDDATPNCDRTCKTLGRPGGNFINSNSDCSPGELLVPGVRDPNTNKKCCCLPN